jgi:hypothetical protein
MARKFALQVREKLDICIAVSMYVHRIGLLPFVGSLNALSAGEPFDA